jgi:lysozyme
MERSIAACFPVTILEENIDPNILREEGRRNVVYDDIFGNRTIGIGFNMDSDVAKRTWEQAAIDRSFEDVYEGKDALDDAEVNRLAEVSQDIAAQDVLDIFPKAYELSPNRQSVLLNLSYQLGKKGLSSFKKLKRAVDTGKWAIAAREILDSDLAKQTPDRARRLARMILAG